MYVHGILQVLKMTSSYFLLMILLPALILGNRLKNEPITKRFMRYLVFGNIYLSTIVFTLAYLHRFTRGYLLVSLIISSFVLYAIVNRQELPEKIEHTQTLLKELILNEYGWHVFLVDMKDKGVRFVRRLYEELFAHHKIEWLLFLAILFFNLYQYSINSFDFTTYIAPDEEVHLYWIQSLSVGEIYPDGVYPHIFHTILGALLKLFNIRGMDLILYFEVTAVILIITTLYIGIRKVFHSKYAALLGLMLFSTLNIFIEHATYRYQFTIPQEYGMMMLFPMALFLFDYMNKQEKKDLLFFGLALALTIGIHPYTGAIALVLAGSIGLFYIGKMIREKLFWKLLAGGLLSFVLAIAPLAIGVASGHGLEQSFAWGSDVITGEVYSKTSEGIPKEDIEEEEEELNGERFVRGARMDLQKYLMPNPWHTRMLLLIIYFSVLYNIATIVKKDGDLKSEYQLIFSLNSLFLFLLILFKALNLPTVMEPKRIAIYFAYFSTIHLGMPLEMLSRMMPSRKNQFLRPTLALSAIGLSLFGVWQMGLMRDLPPLYYFQPSGTMLANMKIMDEYKDDTWTAISPVNNISSVLQKGYHYELDQFILEQEDWNPEKEIHIPTPHVFLYVEKRPIIKYGDEFKRNSPTLEKRPLITEEDAAEKLTETTEENYHYKQERKILMAKANAWAEEYATYFPKEMSVYYEDSELIVYQIEQNSHALNNLNINYHLNSR